MELSQQSATAGKRKRKKKGKNKAEQSAGMETPGTLELEESHKPSTPSTAALSTMVSGPGKAAGAAGTGPASAAEGSQVLSSPGAIGKQTPTKPRSSNPVQGREGLLPVPAQGKDGLLPAPVPGRDGLLPPPVRGAQQPLMPNPAAVRSAKQAAPAKVSQGREAAKGRSGAPMSDAALQSLQDKQGSDMFLKELEKENIHTLKKKSMKFPKAVYFCRTCEYHLDRPEDCRNHIKDTRHKKATESIAAANVLKGIPPPRWQHKEELTKMLQQIYKDFGLTPEDVKIRQKCVAELQNFISEAMSDVNAKVRHYGSSFTGLGLKGCDINVDLYTPNTPIRPKMLQDLHNVAEAKMKTGELFSSITCNFSSLVPTLLLTLKETGLVCQVAVACYTSCLTSHLLKAYSCLDPRVAPLCVAFRYWAKLCKVDKHDRGTLPPYAYDLMTMHYLQSTVPPVLPILSKNLPKYDPKNPKEDECDWFVEMKIEAEAWQSANTECLGGLWLGMLRYYCLTFDMANKVVTLSKDSDSLKDLKCFQRKKLGIDDPYLQRRNVARTLFNNRIHDYLQECLRQTFLYFALPRDKQGKSYISLELLQEQAEQRKTESPEKPLEAERSCQPGAGEREGKRNQDPRLLNDSNNACLPDREKDVSDDDDNDDDDDIDENMVADGLKSFTFTNSSVERMASEDSLPLEASSQDEYAYCMASAIIDSALHSEKLRASAAVAASAESKDADNVDAEPECYFEFVAKNVAVGDGPVVICGYCDKEGHLKMHCPEDKVPPPDPLPPLTPEYIHFLNSVLEKVPGDFMPTDTELAKRHAIVRELEKYIRRIDEEACLQLFGSSRNGFVFRQSDLDICITYANKSPQEVDPVKKINSLSRHLRACREVDNVTPITTAKVPIVKFTVRDGNLDGDISVYNILAQHNTHLLECYSRIDRRVQTLGYLIKVFVKICEIGDASKGSLSSYAYILMVLHYLQQRKPPVIPVLQELYTGEKPERLVEGWNAWFYDDIDNLPKVWEDYGKNKESVAELWIGLFRYYTEQFNCKEHVVCVRQRDMLTRFEKLWNGACLAIEDPFELSHNLGTGLNKRMNNFIFTIMQRGRTLYGTPVDSEAWIRKCASPQDYFFDSNTLRISAPPNDRGCRLCGRIGHIAKKCTNPLQSRDNLGKKGAKGPNAGNADRKKNQGAVASPMMQGNMQQPPMMHQNMGYGQIPAQNWLMGRPQRPGPAEASRGGPRSNQHGRGPFPGPDAMPGGVGGPPGGSLAEVEQEREPIRGYTNFAGKDISQARLSIYVPPQAGDGPRVNDSAPVHMGNFDPTAFFQFFLDNPSLLQRPDRRMKQQPENREQLRQMSFVNQQQQQLQQLQQQQQQLQQLQQQHLQQQHLQPQQQQQLQQQPVQPLQQQLQQQPVQPLQQQLQQQQEQSLQQQQQLLQQQQQPQRLQPQQQQLQPQLQQQQRLQPQQQDQQQQQQQHGQTGHNQHEQHHQQHHSSHPSQQQPQQHQQQYLQQQHLLQQRLLQHQQFVQHMRGLPREQQLRQALQMHPSWQLLDVQQPQEEMNKAFMAQPGMRPNMNMWMPPQFGQEGQGRDHPSQRSPRS